MLSALPDGAPPYYAGPIHGQLDAATQDAVRRFQADHGLTVDGAPGPQTRRALVTAYMSIDGTSLPAGTDVQRHGCGEHHHAVPTPDETDEQANRRVEVFFFEGPVAPPPQPRCPSPGCPEYPEWLRRTILTIDFTNPPPTLANARWEDVDDDELLVRASLRDWQGRPCPRRPATVLVGDRAFFGVADGDGVLAVPVPVGTTAARIRYQPGPVAQRVELPVVLALPGIDTDDGVALRLQNLGYPAARDLAYALRCFQLQFGLAMTATADAATRLRLLDVHDHGAAP